MLQVFKSIYDMTFGLVIQFINEVLSNHGYDATGLEQIPLKIGFGQIEWLNTNLFDLYVVISTTLMSVLFLMLVWKVFKFFSKLVGKAFGKW